MDSHAEGQIITTPTNPPQPTGIPAAPSTRTAGADTWAERIDLFIVSWLILFLELACIRWFPARVLFLTFFTNLVLLACFVGMSIGCLAARSKRNWLTWTPWLLLGFVVLVFLVSLVRMGGSQ